MGLEALGKDRGALSEEADCSPEVGAMVAVDHSLVRRQEWSHSLRQASAGLPNQWERSHLHPSVIVALVIAFQVDLWAKSRSELAMGSPMVPAC